MAIEAKSVVLNSTKIDGKMSLFTKEVDRMIRFIEPTLYIDPQAAVPVGFCEKCGGECYAPGCVCRCCEEDAP